MDRRQANLIRRHTGVSVQNAQADSCGQLYDVAEAVYRGREPVASNREALDPVS